MHLLLWAEDSEAELRRELALAFPGAQARPGPPGVLETDFAFGPGQPLPHLAFLRQILPNARPAQAESIRGWAELLAGEILGVLPDEQPWALHIAPHYGAPAVHHIGARAWHTHVRKAWTRSKATDPTQREGTGPHPGTARRRRKSETRNPKSDPLRRRDSAARTNADGWKFPNWKTEAGEISSRLASKLGYCSAKQSLALQDREQIAPEAGAGRHRCRLIREAVNELLRRKRRHLLRQLRFEPGHFKRNEALVQLLLATPAAGFLSIAEAPLPFEQRHVISCFPKGELAQAEDEDAPSRAFAKLAEAELRLGRAIRAAETCVDLGAAPGSWTYVARNRGARVLAVDRAGLREDLMREPGIEFRRADAFDFKPTGTVDWLLCDVLAPPERTAGLLLEWLRRGWCRHFVVTLKLKEASGVEALETLKRELPLVTHEFFLTRLCANKKEVCAFGTRVKE